MDASTDRVGIGTTSPTEKFEVDPDGDSDVVLGRLKAGSASADRMHLSHFDHFSTTNFALSQTSSGATVLNAASGQVIAFQTAGVNKARFDPLGKLGINLTDPDAMLEIATNSATEEGLKIKGSASQSANLFLMTDSSDVTFMSSGDGLAGSEIVWNDAGADINWRHESDNAANLLFLDAGLDTGAGGIGVFGTSPQIQQAHIADPTDLATCISALSTLLADLEGYGWLKNA